MRESFVFYASFYKAITLFNTNSQVKLYDAICNYGLNDIEPKNLSKEELAVFILMKFILDNYSILTSKEIRASKGYRMWRAEVLKRDFYTCQICGSQENLQAHHINRFSTDKDERFNIDNGITVCDICHRKIHSKGVGNGR